MLQKKIELHFCGQNAAMKIKAPVERELSGESMEEKMAWTEKVAFAVDTYKNYKRDPWAKSLTPGTKFCII